MVAQRVDPQELHPARRGRHPAPDQREPHQREAGRLEMRPFARALPVGAFEAGGRKEARRGEDRAPKRAQRGDNVLSLGLSRRPDPVAREQEHRHERDQRRGEPQLGVARQAAAPGREADAREGEHEEEGDHDFAPDPRLAVREPPDGRDARRRHGGHGVDDGGQRPLSRPGEEQRQRKGQARIGGREVPRDAGHPVPGMADVVGAGVPHPAHPYRRYLQLEPAQRVGRENGDRGDPDEEPAQPADQPAPEMDRVRQARRLVERETGGGEGRHHLQPGADQRGVRDGRREGQREDERQRTEREEERQELVAHRAPPASHARRRDHAADHEDQEAPEQEDAARPLLAADHREGGGHQHGDGARDGEHHQERQLLQPGDHEVGQADRTRSGPEARAVRMAPARHGQKKSTAT